MVDDQGENVQDNVQQGPDVQLEERNKSVLLPLILRDLLNRHIPKAAIVSIETQETNVSVGMADDGVGARIVVCPKTCNHILMTMTPVR